MIEQLTLDTRKALNMTLAEFADALNEQMPAKVTLAAVHHWQTGRRKPRISLMELMVRVYPQGDWRHEFAASMIDALRAESLSEFIAQEAVAEPN